MKRDERTTRTTDEMKCGVMSSRLTSSVVCGDVLRCGDDMRREDTAPTQGRNTPTRHRTHHTIPGSTTTGERQRERQTERETERRTERETETKKTSTAPTAANDNNETPLYKSALSLLLSLSTTCVPVVTTTIRWCICRCVVQCRCFGARRMLLPCVIVNVTVCQQCSGCHAPCVCASRMRHNDETKVGRAMTMRARKQLSMSFPHCLQQCLYHHPSHCR